jgi:hypothetical protein
MRRRRRPPRSGRRLVAAAVAAALALGGCGGDDESAEDVVRATDERLGEIRSGELYLSFEVRARGAGVRGPVGARLAGPFALPEAGALPRARIRYTQLAGAREARGTLIATGRRAYVRIAGTTYRLPASQEDALRAAATGERGESGLAALGLDVAGWLERPRLAGGGDATQRVTAELDVVALLEDVLPAVGDEGDAPRLDGEAARRLRRAVRRSSVVLVTGTDDRLLRRVAITADFELPPDLRALTGGVASGSLAFELRIARPNLTVRIADPRDALPASALGVR